MVTHSIPLGSIRNHSIRLKQLPQEDGDGWSGLKRHVCSFWKILTHFCVDDTHLLFLHFSPILLCPDSCFQLSALLCISLPWSKDMWRGIRLSAVNFWPLPFPYSDLGLCGESGARISGKGPEIRTWTYLSWNMPMVLWWKHYVWIPLSLVVLGPHELL